MSLRERLAFLAQFRADFEHTGAIQPSSRWLAREMTRPLRQKPEGPRHIGEIGPGTGAVTRAIAAAMTADDRLDCYEINAEFARFLTTALREDPTLSSVAARVTIHNRPAQDMEPSEAFDFVVCSAPLNNFDAATIDAIFDAALGALKPAGTFTFFEYVGLPALRRSLSAGATRVKLLAARAAKERRLAAHAHTSAIVWRNLPPARAHHLTLATDEPVRSDRSRGGANYVR